MRRGGAHVTQAYFLPLWNILELDSYMIRLAAKGWIRRSPIGAGALSSKRGRREVCIVPIDERQCPNPKCGGRRRALGGGPEARATGEDAAGDDAARASRGDKAAGASAGTRPAPGNAFLTHAQSKRRQSGLYRSRVTWRALGRHQTGAGRLVRYSYPCVSFLCPSRRRDALQFKSYICRAPCWR